MTNTLQKVMKAEDLTIMCLVLECCDKTKALATIDFKKFFGDRSGWKIR